MHAESHAFQCALAGWASFYDAVGDGSFGKLRRVVAVGKGTSKFEVKQAT